MNVTRGTAAVAWALLAGVLVAPGTATAAGETCHGQPATVVGSPGSTVVGGDGLDVIVSNGADRVDAGGGDDLICVTAGAGRGDVFVDAGAGADHVDTSAMEASRSRVTLGPGDDTFVGGSKADTVDAAVAFAEEPDGEGSDDVRTGGGPDLVFTGGSAAAPDQDTVDLGPGADVAWLQGVSDPAYPIGGGAGPDKLEIDRVDLSRPLVFDNRAGAATDAGVRVLSWTGMERFRFSPIGRYAPPAFLGGAASERVWTSIPMTWVRLGRGDDRLTLELQGRLVDKAAYSGGPGRDELVLYAGPGDQARRVRVDVPGRRLLFERGAQAVRARLGNFEAYRLSAERLDFLGGGRAETVGFAGCHGSVRGGPGSDRIHTISIDDVGCGYPVPDVDLVVSGGAGDDILVGGDMPDVLLGGPGLDSADGARGQDRCVAERERRCER